MLFELIIAAILAVGWMGTTWVLVAKLEEEKERRISHFSSKMELLREYERLKEELTIYKEKESKSLINKIKAVLHRGEHKGE